MSIAEIIKYYRTKKEINQAHLAEQMFVDRSLISKWENGSRTPTLKQMKRLAQILDIPDSLYYPFEDEPAEIGINNRTSSTFETAGKTIVIDNEVKHYITFFCLIIISLILIPFGFPFSIAATVYQVRKKLPKQFYPISAVILFYCLYQFFFLFGIYLIPPIIQIN